MYTIKPKRKGVYFGSAVDTSFIDACLPSFLLSFDFLKVGVVRMCRFLWHHTISLSVAFANLGSWESFEVWFSSTRQYVHVRGKTHS